MKNRSIKISRVILYIAVFLVSCAFVWPFIYVLSVSFSRDVDLLKYGSALIPRSFTLEAYEYLVMFAPKLFSGLKVSTFITVAGTLLSTIVTSMMAYALAHKNLPYRSFFMKAIFFTMLFNGGMIPMFLMVKNLGLLDNLWSLILPVLVSSWNLIIMRNFFMEIPESLEESALCDGANHIQILLRIILPVSKPILATIALFYAVSYWNSWFTSLLYITTPSKIPAMLLLRQLLSFSENPMAILSNSISRTKPPSEPLKMATTVMITAPILISYPFAQKYFVKGVMMGSIKG